MTYLEFFFLGGRGGGGDFMISTRRHDDALSKQRKFLCKTKALNNLWSQGYPQRLSHSQHNVKLSIITSFKQRESSLRRKRRYLRSKL